VISILCAGRPLVNKIPYETRSGEGRQAPGRVGPIDPQTLLYVIIYIYIRPRLSEFGGIISSTKVLNSHFSLGNSIHS